MHLLTLMFYYLFRGMEHGDGSAQTSWTGGYLCEGVCMYLTLSVCGWADVVGEREMEI